MNTSFLSQHLNINVETFPRVWIRRHQMCLVVFGVLPPKPLHASFINYFSAVLNDLFYTVYAYYMLCCHIQQKDEKLTQAFPKVYVTFKIRGLPPV